MIQLSLQRRLRKPTRIEPGERASFAFDLFNSTPSVLPIDVCHLDSLSSSARQDQVRVKVSSRIFRLFRTAIDSQSLGTEARGKRSQGR
jgi:hypothetical protein